MKIYWMIENLGANERKQKNHSKLLDDDKEFRL